MQRSEGRSGYGPSSRGPPPQGNDRPSYNRPPQGPGNRPGAGPGYPESANDIISKFASYLYGHIRRFNVDKTNYMYEVNYPFICASYFNKARLETSHFVADFVENDEKFLLLYQNVYDRISSWKNYCRLFDLVIADEIVWSLPVGWLYDLIDEFCYQFQAFCQFKSKGTARTIEELDCLDQHPEAWSPQLVLSYLHRLVEASNVEQHIAEQGPSALTLHEDSQPNVTRILGYFSLLGLLRVYTLMGDYDSALKALRPVQLHERNAFTQRVPAAHVSLYYYSGFCYLMMGRYLDSTRAFNTILMFIQRVKSQIQKQMTSVSFDMILKKMEQVYALLAITVALQPACQRILDDSVSSGLKDKYPDKINKMVSGEPVTNAREELAVVQLFQYACPKFIVCTPASARGQYDHNQDNYWTQLQVMLKQVALQEQVHNVKQFLRLYTSISISKLATLLDMPTNEVRQILMYMKTRTIAPRHDGSLDLTAGKFIAFTDVEFHLDWDTTSHEEIVVVADSKPVKRHVEFLVRNIQKFTDLTHELENPQPLKHGPPGGRPGAVQKQAGRAEQGGGGQYNRGMQGRR